LQNLDINLLPIIHTIFTDFCKLGNHKSQKISSRLDYLRFSNSRINTILLYLNALCKVQLDVVAQLYRAPYLDRELQINAILFLRYVCVCIFLGISIDILLGLCVSYLHIYIRVGVWPPL
jgi:hypothetical protein